MNKKFMRGGYTTGTCAAAGGNVTLHPVGVTRNVVAARKKFCERGLT